MAFLNRTSYDIRATGKVVTVPNNDVARCMYYLSCVCNTIDYNDGQIRRFTDYERFWNLSDDEEEIVYKLCLTLSPDEFEDKVFFENDSMCKDSNNEFYEIGRVQNQLLVVSSLMIGGRSRQVKKIMCYKRSWMLNNYVRPMNRLADRFSPERKLIRALEDSDCSIS